MSAAPARPTGDEKMGKHLAITFALALVIYAAFFSVMQHQRTAKGPWEIVFIADSAGHPSLQISQPRLGLAAKLVFPGDEVARTNLSQRIKFSELTTNLPFGQLLFQDPLYLPGDVTLRICGHQIEALPRTLIIDKTEHPWPSAAEIIIPAR